MPSVDFSDDELHVTPDKTEMARFKRLKRARQDDAEREDDDDDPMTMVNTRPLPKKRRNGVTLGSSSNGFGLSSQDKEKLVKVAERLRKDADKLPVNEGESESSLCE